MTTAIILSVIIGAAFAFALLAIEEHLVADRTEEPAVVDSKGLAQILDVHPKHVARLDRAGKLPTPIRLGKCKKWLKSIIFAWLNAGAPNRAKWEAMREAGPKAKSSRG